MAQRRSKARKVRAEKTTNQSERRTARPIAFGGVAEGGNFKNCLRISMPAKNPASGNEYSCAIERNRNGKYNVRIRVVFGRGAWSLPVYFLASTFDGAMKKLEESLQVLQRVEDRLRFWGVERSDDPNVAGDLLQEFGLRLDRRAEFPRKAAEIGIPSLRPVPASMLAPVRRLLADAMSHERIAAAGD